MKVLIINAGSSSVKFNLYESDGEKLLAKGLIERIKSPEARLKYTNDRGAKFEKSIRANSYEAAISEACLALMDKTHGVIESLAEIAAIGHRVVHGGADITGTVRITEKIKQIIVDCYQVAPLHNPPNYEGIEACEHLFPNVPNAAVFDTAFHQTLPKHAFMYALPYEFYTKHRVRRYGFHGTSHKFITFETARLLQKPLEKVSLISIHLGNGCSMAAVHRGKCVDTTMGLTPLEGLVMGTRSGDLDPAIHDYLANQTGLSLKEITEVLNKKSGLKGLCGTNDVREVLAKYEAGEAQAVLAIDLYCYRIKKYIGSYSAVLPEMDAIVFTAGVGQNAAQVRAKVCEGMERIGIVMDPVLNNTYEPVAHGVHAAYSPVKILIIPTNEELQIARETKAILKPE